MTVLAVAARVKRLEALGIGLAKELARWSEANDPLLYRERQAYLAALRRALSGVEGARVALARARQRLEGEATEQPVAR
jgi:hypothetical protein